MGFSGAGGSALVLGGGGVTGVAWEIGVLAGLAERGVDLTAADRVIGTSAGSVVGALVAGGVGVEEMYGAQLVPPVAEVPARLRRRTMAYYLYCALRARSPQEYGARLGRMALRARTMTEAERREVFVARLPAAGWPSRPLQITAMDAQTGDFAVLDRDSGAALVDAVGASCAVPGVWPPVTIDGRRYIDGGMRSPANADLAAGADRVVVIAPLTRAARRSGSVAAQVARLAAGGARVEAVAPDATARRAIGRNVLDPTRRADAARAGRAQAARVHARVAAVWDGTA
ncbi:patatin-like phospholipase family protein [Rhizomonospora bruguierae]|uniref:patatin-like phospholipase family protein n=1 Tax=Rhizomonospora bruguierae TaxID=1581705 RepID=UPI001BD150C9|nr:patatin-like phospholipase family protein [Micromonospora sp. NBRC 107566]